VCYIFTVADDDKRAVRERDLDPVPKLPRDKSLRWMWNDVFRIAFLVLMLVAVITLKDQCAGGVGKFIGSFEPPDAGLVPDVGLAPPGWELVPADQVDIKKMFPSGDAGAGDTASPDASSPAPPDRSPPAQDRSPRPARPESAPTDR